MPIEIFPGIFRIQVPMPNKALGFLNAYLLRTEKGCLLVDTGWNDDTAWKSLQSGIQECGVSLTEVAYIIITHVHPDHYGLVGRLSAATSARLMLHPAEQNILSRRSNHCRETAASLAGWFRSNGMPVEPDQLFTLQTLKELGLLPAPMTTRLIEDGEHVSVGGFDLQVLLTPGHSPGHICLYDRLNHLLFCGDHILAGITPNISLQDDTGSNPLQDYLQSLDRIAGLEVCLALPGHGEPMSDIHEHLGRIRLHHQQRSDEVMASLKGGPLNACQVAGRIRWFGREGAFVRLPLIHRRWALTETLAHLEYLRYQGSVSRSFVDGLYQYSLLKDLT